MDRVFFSYEELLMDSEIWNMLCATLCGIVVDDQTLALEAIRQVGPGGHYLSHRHTLKHMRELWQPTLMDRRPYSVWEERRDGAREWAREKAQRILREHPGRRLEDGLRSELARIIALAEQRS